MPRTRSAALPIVLLASIIPRIHSLPLIYRGISNDRQNDSPRSHPIEYKDRTTYMIISACLVLMGGVFAGLTLGLMGQDEVYLKVISTSGSPKERKLASKVLSLISRGKHWLLVTLLLSNVITNETLPIVLDRCLGGGWQAVASSTVLIVIFGEVIPQSVCVKYGLEIGAFFTPFVRVLMYVMFPVAYPVAVLLDYILGEDHGTMYKKSGLKTLVTLHRTMGVERLTQDEVTIISAVLDLKEKQVQEIMTPIENVFTMSADRVLDEKTVGEIFDSGFSRIPIYLPNEPTNFIGMLLVRVLISYDPEDALPVSHFPLATLPETDPKTSCLNILNYFQEGKSHMCVVSKDLGSATGAIGVLTLEDVIEELIGEEIVDESDVFVNIHQRTIREQPGPLSKRHITSYLHRLYTNSNKRASTELHEGESQALLNNGVSVKSLPLSSTASHREGTQNLRLSSPLPGSDIQTPLVLPSNPAANPLDVNKPFVTIKRPDPSLTTKASSFYGTMKKPTKSSLKESSSDSNQDGRHLKVSQSPAEHETIDSHVEAANRAREFTERTGTPVQVTTNLGIMERTPKSGNVGAHDKPENTLVSSSYKSTNHGIVESIITVKGVPKTIIEPAKNWDQNPVPSEENDSRDQLEPNAIANGDGDDNGSTDDNSDARSDAHSNSNGRANADTNTTNSSVNANNSDTSNSDASNAKNSRKKQLKNNRTNGRAKGKKKKKSQRNC